MTSTRQPVRILFAYDSDEPKPLDVVPRSDAEAFGLALIAGQGRSASADRQSLRGERGEFVNHTDLMARIESAAVSTIELHDMVRATFADDSALVFWFPTGTATVDFDLGAVGMGTPYAWSADTIGAHIEATAKGAALTHNFDALLAATPGMFNMGHVVSALKARAAGAFIRPVTRGTLPDGTRWVSFEGRGAYNNAGGHLRAGYSVSRNGLPEYVPVDAPSELEFETAWAAAEDSSAG